MRWYVVHTQPQAEPRAVQHLKNQGFDCFLPRITALRRHARQVKSVLLPLFPRYLFVRFDLDVMRWRSINGTRGVVGLLTNGRCPVPVPSDAFKALLSRCDERGVTTLAALDFFTKGLKVQIKSGAFAGQTGEVGELLTRDRDRVRVLLCIMGVQTSLLVPAYAIEAA
jgi:transcriptional antiterminator RfaH